MKTLTYNLFHLTNKELRSYFIRSKSSYCVYSQGFKKAIRREMTSRGLS